MNDSLKEKISGIKKRLGSGDIARIADILSGTVKRADVYNILNGKGLKDLWRVKQVIIHAEQIADERDSILS